MKHDYRKCYFCINFRAYYTMDYCCLVKENIGYCNCHKKIVNNDDGCSEWHFHYTPKETRTKIALNSIPELYEKIAVIEQILKEDIELRKMREEAKI